MNKGSNEFRLVKRAFQRLFPGQVVPCVVLTSKAILEHYGIPVKSGDKIRTQAVAAIKSGKSRGTTKPKAKRVNSGDDFYKSWEWKQVRYSVLKKYHNRCQCCGWTPGDTRHGYLVVDHIKPRKLFPELSLDVNNLQILCNDCNMGKSQQVDDWRHMDEAFKATIQ